MITFNLNGHLKTEDHLLLPVDQNGSFWYGNGFFDAIKYSNGEIHFLSLHWDRLVKSCRLLHLNNPFNHMDDFGFHVKLLAKLNPQQSQRIKLIIWGHSSQGYKSSDPSSEFLITTSPLSSNSYDLNVKGLSIITYTDNLKSFSPLGNIKSTSSALYVLATQFAQAHQMDDAMIFNTYDRPIESSKMNIFLIQGNSIVTPNLEEGCLDGIMRRVMISLCQDLGIALIQKPIEKFDLESCDGILATSAIQGIQWINKVNNRTFQMPQMVVTLSQKLNQNLMKTNEI